MIRAWLLVSLLTTMPLPASAEACQVAGGQDKKAQIEMPAEKPPAAGDRKSPDTENDTNAKRLRDLEKVGQAQRKGLIDLQQGIAPGPGKSDCD